MLLRGSKSSDTDKRTGCTKRFVGKPKQVFDYLTDCQIFAEVQLSNRFCSQCRLPKRKQFLFIFLHKHETNLSCRILE